MIAAGSVYNYGDSAGNTESSQHLQSEHVKRGGAENSGMQMPLLKTKLFVPARRDDLVPRFDLLKRLDKVGSHRLTLLSAQAGSGKTTLLGSWIRSDTAFPVCWLSIDETDNDPTSFILYVIAAFQKIEKSIAKASLALLTAPEPSQTETILMLLINELAEIPHDVALVVDDYHVIENQEVHKTVQFLIDHAPQNLHLIISSRSDPPLPLARLRARNELLELRSRDLFFSPEETGILLNRIMKLSLSAQEIENLNTATEGWITALQLAGLSLKTQDDKSAFINNFTASNRFVLDYLIEEVLSKLPADVHDFLLHTSVLKRFTCDLCDHVTGKEGSKKILQLLEDSNMFVVPLDDERMWFRYHHLFADLLRKRLFEVQPDTVAGLHRRAGLWYRQNELHGEAIEHAITAGDYDSAVEIIEKQAWFFLMKQGVTTVIVDWMNRLPEEIIAGHPRLNLTYAWALFIHLKIDRIEDYLKPAEAALEKEPDGAMSGEINMIRATVAIFTGNNHRAVRLFREALEQTPEENLDIIGITQFGLGYAYMVNDEMESASKILREAFRLNCETGYMSIALKSICFLSYVQLAQGRMRKAGETFEESLSVARAYNMENAPVMALAYGGLAEWHRERNHLDASREYALKAVKITDNSRELLRLWASHVVMSDVKAALHDSKAAREELEKALKLIEKSRMIPWIVRTKTCILSDKILNPGAAGFADLSEDIEEWMSDCRLGDDWINHAAAVVEPCHTREFEFLTLARINMIQKKYREALEIIEPLINTAEKAGRRRSLLKVLCLKSVILFKQGLTSKALVFFQETLELAEPEGYVRTFVDNHPEIVMLLSKSRERIKSKSLQKYISRLLPAIEFDRKNISAHDMGVSDLSEREIEVLRLASGGLSNKDISDKLYISLNTVKTHFKNINVKLDTSSRTSAAARGRELKIL